MAWVTVYHARTESEADDLAELLASHAVEADVVAVPGQTVEQLMAGGGYEVRVARHQREFAKSLIDEDAADDDDEVDEEFLARIDGQQRSRPGWVAVVAVLLVLALLATVVAGVI